MNKSQLARNHYRVPFPISLVLTNISENLVGPFKHSLSQVIASGDDNWREHDVNKLPLCLQQIPLVIPDKILWHSFLCLQSACARSAHQDNGTTWKNCRCVEKEVNPFSVCYVAVEIKKKSPRRYQQFVVWIRGRSAMHEGTPVYFPHACHGSLVNKALFLWKENTRAWLDALSTEITWREWWSAPLLCHKTPWYGTRTAGCRKLSWTNSAVVEGNQPYLVVFPILFGTYPWSDARGKHLVLFRTLNQFDFRLVRWSAGKSCLRINWKFAHRTDHSVSRRQSKMFGNNICKREITDCMHCEECCAQTSGEGNICPGNMPVKNGSRRPFCHLS